MRRCRGTGDRLTRSRPQLYDSLPRRGSPAFPYTASITRMFAMPSTASVGDGVPFADGGDEGAQLVGVGRLAGNALGRGAVGCAHGEAVVEVRRDRIEDAHLAALAAHEAVEPQQARGEQRAGDAAACDRRRSGSRRSSSGRPSATTAAPRRDHLRLGAGEEAHHVDRVAADVHRRRRRRGPSGSGCRPAAASGMHIVASMWRSGAEHAGVDDRPHARRQRVVALVERLDQDAGRCARPPPPSCRASSALEASGFSQSTCLPASQRPDGPLGVQAVRQRIVDGVDLRIGEQRVVAIVRRAECRAWRANARARAGSRAATAMIAASGTERAGRMSAIGAMRAAPRMPMRRGAAVVMAALT